MSSLGLATGGRSRSHRGRPSRALPIPTPTWVRSTGPYSLSVQHGTGNPRPPRVRNGVGVTVGDARTKGRD